MPERLGMLPAACLIAGKSGSGKSTTTLACLTSGLLYAGDDYVLADIAGEPYVHSLYSTAKLVPDNCDRFPQLIPWFRIPTSSTRRKLSFICESTFPPALSADLPLRAILLPRVTGLPETKLVKAGAMDAFRAIAPTTLLHLARATDEASRKISALCRSLPVYWLDAGTDLPQIPRVITEFLERFLKETRDDGRRKSGKRDCPRLQRGIVPSKGNSEYRSSGLSSS